jgi:hypothetical protein
MNQEGHEASRSFAWSVFPACDFGAFAVHGFKSSHYRALIHSRDRPCGNSLE